MSERVFVSSGVSVARDMNATDRPSAEIEGADPPKNGDAVAFEAISARVVRWVVRSKTKTPLRLGNVDARVNARKRPSGVATISASNPNSVGSGKAPTTEV